MSDGFPTIRRCLLLLAGALSAPMVAQAALWQSIDSIENAAQRHATASLKFSHARVEIRVDRLDPRLRLTQCDAPLASFMPTRVGAVRRRAIVGVRCPSPKPWKIYVPVTIAVYRDVVISDRPLPRGAKLAAADVRLVERDVAALPYAYLSDPRQLEGNALRRALPEGAVITVAMLDAQRVIRRGQNVRLVARHKGLQVQMNGRALMDGAVDQRIMVENLSSKRVIEGVVRSAQVVEVIL